MLYFMVYVFVVLDEYLILRLYCSFLLSLHLALHRWAAGVGARPVGPVGPGGAVEARIDQVSDLFDVRRSK